MPDFFSENICVTKHPDRKKCIYNPAFQIAYSIKNTIYINPNRSQISVHYINYNKYIKTILS